MSSDSMKNEILRTIRRIIRAIDLQSRKLAKTHGLTGPQLVVLKELAKEKEISIGTLSQNISLSQATVTNIVERLESKGAALRKRSDKDKRRVIVYSTPKTFKLLDHNPSLLQDKFVLELEKLKEWEQTMLLASLQRLASMMDAESIDAQPLLHSGPLTITDKAVTEFLEKSEDPRD